LEIIVVVLALTFLQIWGAKNPLHRDAWFLRWQAWLEAKDEGAKEWLSFVAVALPLALVLIVFELLMRQSIWLALPLAVLVLLYSFGRGEFFEIVREYTQACYIEDWESAGARAARLNVDLADIQENDWSGLHQRVFDEAGYRGFERMFAVLFWFFLLGPLGALMYRLVFLQVHGEQPNTLAKRWLWILEWPAVRVLGLSFALTGNFGGCIARWKETLFCAKRATEIVLSRSILGALSVEDEMEQTCEVTRKELNLLSTLYQRTLWLWLFVASFVIIFS
jgi:AmpE protein